MEKGKLMKTQNQRKNSMVKSVKSRKLEVSENKPITFTKVCFIAIIPITIGLLLSGKIIETFYLVGGSSILLPVFNQLERLLWDEQK